MKRSKLVLYNVEWQILRVSLLAENNFGVGWNCMTGVYRNLNKLKEYLTVFQGHNQQLNRLYRVRNLISGVLLGYAQQGIDIMMYDYAREVKKYGDHISKSYREYKENYTTTFFEETEQDVIHSIKKANIRDLKKVFYDLRCYLIVLNLA